MRDQYIISHTSRLGTDLGHRNTQEYSDKKKINDTGTGAKALQRSL